MEARQRFWMEGKFKQRKCWKSCGPSTTELITSRDDLECRERFIWRRSEESLSVFVRSKHNCVDQRNCGERRANSFVKCSKLFTHKTRVHTKSNTDKNFWTIGRTTVISCWYCINRFVNWTFGIASFTIKGIANALKQEVTKSNGNTHEHTPSFWIVWRVQSIPPRKSLSAPIGWVWSRT